MLVSHRGATDGRLIAENTLAAFARAAALGAAGIETDLRLDRDDRIVLFHDRNASDGRPVDELSRDELSAVVGYDVPLLEEALAAHPGLFWNLELKTPRVVEPLAQLLEGTAPRGGVLVTSFWHEAVEHFRHISLAPVGILMSHRPLHPRHAFWKCREHGYSAVVGDMEFFDATIVAQAAAQGLATYVYGVETQAEHEDCLGWRLTGFLTDHVALGRRALEERRTAVRH